MVIYPSTSEQTKSLTNDLRYHVYHILLLELTALLCTYYQPSLLFLAYHFIIKRATVCRSISGRFSSQMVVVICYGAILDVICDPVLLTKGNYSTSLFIVKRFVSRISGQSLTVHTRWKSVRFLNRTFCRLSLLAFIAMIAQNTIFFYSKDSSQIPPIHFKISFA